MARRPLTVESQATRRAAILAVALLAGCSRCRPGTSGDAGSPGPSGGAVDGFEHVALAAGGRAREYLLHVPPGRAARGPMSLVISLHGGGGTAERVDGQTGWRDLADREGFAVAFPSGIGKSWNDGRVDTPSTAVRENIDDVGFLADVIEDVAKRITLDRGHVFMNGISNGAFMTSRFACERAPLLAAFGLVAGTIGPESRATCHPAPHLSAIVFSGTADPIVPFEGGSVHVGRARRGLALSFSEAIELWTGNGRCSAPQASDLPDADGDDDSTVHLDAYPCGGGAAVHGYTILGGGHTWPGGKQYLPRFVVGQVNRDVDATRTMWSFFAAHPRQ